MRLETYGIAATPPDVRALFDRQRKPEGSWAWFETLADTTLAAREEACVIGLVGTEGNVLAAMPLVLVDGRPIRGLTSPFTTLFCCPLGGNDAAREFGRLLAGRVGAGLRLDALDGAQPAVAALAQGLADGGLAVLKFRHFANWFEHVGDFDTYWAGRDSRLRSTVKRKSAPLLREGQLRFAMIDLGADWREGTGLYEAIYAKSWKPAEPHPHFIGKLLENLGSRDIARLAVAWIGDAPAAAQIWLVQDGGATIFKLAHDPAFDRQSAGTLLTHWAFGRLCGQDGVRDVDFGRGDDAYKRLWLSSTRDRVGLLAANPKSFKGMTTVLFDILPAKIAAALRSNRTAIPQS